MNMVRPSSGWRDICRPGPPPFLSCPTTEIFSTRFPLVRLFLILMTGAYFYVILFPPSYGKNYVLSVPFTTFRCKKRSKFFLKRILKICKNFRTFCTVFWSRSNLVPAPAMRPSLALGKIFFVQI